MSMTLIQQIELSSAQNSITFSSIPQIYTDLLVVFSLRAVSGNHPSQSISLNAYGTGTYTRLQLIGSGSAASSNTTTESELYLSQIPAVLNTANTFGNTQVYIPNYTGSANKTLSADLVSEQNATQAYQTITAGYWNQTAAVTSVSLQTYGRTIDLAQYSSAALYGITSGSDGTTAVS